jgi:hypothetical protein
MPRWSESRRRAHSQAMQRYWSRIRRASQSFGISTKHARDFYKKGMFRGVQDEAVQRFEKHYRAERDREGHIRILHDGKPVNPETVPKALRKGFYDAMVGRLQMWTGWTRSQVRRYLSQYPQWREGISPLYRSVKH